MNYAAHYGRLISRATSRCLLGTKERHHVVPRCMGGTDDPANLVDLTPEEHYVAHQLLVKMHPGHLGLAYAVVKMSVQASGRRAYGWVRRRFSESQRGRKLGPHSEDHKAKISAANKGAIRSQELRARISSKLAGRKLPAEHRINIGLGQIGHKRNLGKVRSSENRAKISKALKGRRKPPRSPEHCAKLAMALKGNRNRAFQ